MSTAAIVVCVEVDLDDLREGDTATEAVRDAFAADADAWLERVL